MEREWFWRFLAGAMLFVIGWALWVAFQVSHAPLATRAAHDAAAQARAREVKGYIDRVPPVNTDRLKLSETIAAPLADPPPAK